MSDEESTKVGLENLEDEIDVCKALRDIVKQVPKSDMVLVPAGKPSQWWDCTVELEFEKVEIHKLLQFIADMIE